MSSERVYTPTSHEYFDDIAALFIALASFNAASEAYLNCPVTQIPANPKNGLFLYGRVATYGFPTYKLMYDMVKDIWPNSLQLVRFEPAESPLTYENNVDLKSIGLQNLVRQFVGTAFLKFYERNGSTLKNNFGTQPHTWPELWRFAWLLRNAIAHGDKFAIDNPNTPLTTWRGIAVSTANSGSSWFDLDCGFLGGGDVLELLEELHTSLLTLVR